MKYIIRGGVNKWKWVCKISEKLSLPPPPPHPPKLGTLGYVSYKDQIHQVEIILTLFSIQLNFLELDFFL